MRIRSEHLQQRSEQLETRSRQQSTDLSSIDTLLPRYDTDQTPTQRPLRPPPSKMSRQGQRAGCPPGFNTWPDFQKISWYAIELDDKLSEIQGLNNHIRALKQKEQDALQDAYEFQDKARQWEKKYEEMKTQNDMFKTELPREVMFLRQTVKKAEKEVMLLQGGVAKRDESIQKLRSRLISAKEEYKTEIKLLDDIIDERNNEVNQLRENELELKADIQALDGCWKFEKGRVDKFKVAAEKYDEASLALERLNEILLKYLGDQLQDGLDWPPGHPNNKSNINRALDALDNELHKVSLEPTLSVPPTPKTVSKPPKAIDSLGRWNRVNAGGSDASFRSPSFLAPSQRRHSDTNISRNSVPPNTDKNLYLELGGEDLSDDEAELNESRSSIDSQRSDSATFKKKRGLGSLADRAADILKKGVKDFGKEIGIGLENQNPASAGPPPYNPSGNGQATTPTNDKKRPGLGFRTSTDQGNSNRRNMSMFGNGTAPLEDDSPKPSDKVFADDRKRQLGSRFANKPTLGPIIEYRDKIVEVPVPMLCTKAHVEDQRILNPMIREVEKNAMGPCSLNHPGDHTCPTKEVEKTGEVKVPCYLDHVKDQPPVEPQIKEVIKVMKEVPPQCARQHGEDLAPVRPSRCYLAHCNDHPPLEFLKVMVPCSRDHLADHACPTTEPVVVYEQKQVMVPCSRDHLADHSCPINEVEVIKEVNVPCFLDHVNDRPPVSPKIITKEVIKEVIKEVPAKCAKAHVEDQPPMKTEIREIEKVVNEEVKIPCYLDHVKDQPPVEPKIEYKEKKVMVPCSRDHLADHICPTSKAHLDQHTCPPAQVHTIEKIVETPVEIFIDRPIIQEKIVNRYINTKVYGPRNTLWTIFYIYFDLWTIFIAWMNQKSAFTRSAIDKFYSHLPGELQDWCVTDPLVGRTFEVIDAANTYKTEINGRAALLKATKKTIENFDAETEAQNLYNEQDAKNEAKNVPANPNTQPAKVDCNAKGNGSATGTDASTSTPLHNRKPTTPTLHLTDENCMRSSLHSHGYEAEYVLATQYTIRRPPLFSNLLMAILFTSFFIIFFLAACVVREHSSLLRLQGILRPSWFTQPWISQTRGYSGGGALLRSGGFVVDQDWSWIRYLWEAVARFGWLKQVHFYLETTASGGAGYRMPG